MKQQRSFFAPEVIQTSLMDCGPAALKAALSGYGIEVPYDVLRERCATDVDGTCIDALAGLAEELGLGGTEMVVPHDSFLLEEAACLPAIVVQRAGGGALHFVLVWNTLGPLVQVMDPASGRYWMRKSRLLEQMPYIPIAISTERWRRWVASEDSLGPLRVKMRRLGVSRGGIARRLAAADADAGWRAFAALDAAVRMVRALVDGGAIRRGREAEALLDELHERAVAAGARPMEVIPKGFWWATPHADASKLTVHAALVVHFEPRQARAEVGGAQGGGGPPSSAYRRAVAPARPAAVPTPGPAAPARIDDAIPAAVRRELGEARVSPARVLGRMIWDDAPRAVMTSALALAVATVVAEIDVIALRGLFDVARHLTLGYQRVGGLLALAALVVGGALLDWFVATAMRRFGVRLEMRLRVGFAEKLPLLEDHYLRTRPTSDMTSRAHAMHALRDAPPLAARVVRAVLSLAMTAAGVIWIHPGGAAMALGATALCVALPYAFRKPMVESNMRLRTHAAALERFYLDALIGVVPVRLHGAERAVRREHEALLVQWTETARTLHRQHTVLVAVQSLLTTALAVAIVANYILGGGDAVGLLLLVFWSLRLPAAGQELAGVVAESRNVLNAAMRLFAPLGAREVAAGHASQAEAPPPARGVSIELVRAGARAGGHALLRDVSFRIAPGEHVAIVGSSGAGKSTLLGMLLGWLPTEGTVRIDDQDLDAEGTVRLREQTAWVDPAVHIWNRSLLENVTFGAEQAPREALPQAMRDADLLDVLERLPEGWQTQLGDGGGLVSGGQGQRVRLARALMRPGARLVLLDEPFRGLEHERRRALLARARQRWAQATLLLVSHDVADTLEMDRVLVVDGGTVVEDGTPRALLADANSRFRALAEADRALLEGVWGGEQWRRVRVQSGSVVEMGAAS